MLRPNFKTLTRLVAIVVALAWPAAALGADPLAPEEIVKRADAIRNPGDSYFLQVRITSSDQPNEPYDFDVSLLGNTRTLVRTVKPVKARGRNMLMRGEDMWGWVPNLKRAVRVGLNQKLVGAAANGDISRMRWSGDYDPVIESETASEWTLLLTARKKGLTYEKLRIWIAKADFHPLHAEFLSLAGKVLKTAVYKDYRAICGQVRPGEITIQDAVRTDERSTIRILNMEVKTFPESLFAPEGMEE